MNATKTYQIFAFGIPGDANELCRLVEIDEATGTETTLIDDGPAFSTYAAEYERLTGDTTDSADRQYFRESDIKSALNEYEYEYEEVIEDNGLEPIIDRNFEAGTGRIVGFRLSLDSDGGQHGYDRRFGEWQ